MSKEMFQHYAIFICLIVLHKYICFQFFIFILLPVLNFYVCVNLSSVSPHDVLKLKFWE